MTADEVMSFGTDRPPRPTSRLMIGVAATCLVVGFLVGLRIGDAWETRDDGSEGAGEQLLAENEPITVPEQERPQIDKALRIGEWFPQHDRRTTTVAQVRDPIPSGKDRPPASARFVGLMIKTCAHANMDPENAFSVSALDWELIDADGLRRRPQRTGLGTFPRPTYPTRSVAVDRGDCVRGWVVWALPDDFTATTAVFTSIPTWWAPQDDAATAKWKLCGDLDIARG